MGLAESLSKLICLIYFYDRLIRHGRYLWSSGWLVAQLLILTFLHFQTSMIDLHEVIIIPNNFYMHDIHPNELFNLSYNSSLQVYSNSFAFWAAKFQAIVGTISWDYWAIACLNLNVNEPGHLNSLNTKLVKLEPWSLRLLNVFYWAIPTIGWLFKLAGNMSSKNMTKSSGNVGL